MEKTNFLFEGELKILMIYMYYNLFLLNKTDFKTVIITILQFKRANRTKGFEMGLKRKNFTPGL
jgi:hypothetical protein